MAELWKGAPVAAALSEQIAARVEALKARGITPTLAIVRIGERPEDLSYERGACKRCGSLGIEVLQVILKADAAQGKLLAVIEELNRDERVHGCLLLRPLPRHMDEGAVCARLDPAKDVDGITAGSLAKVFTGAGTGFPPCTAQACMELLDYYGYDLTGKRTVVVGRSLVIGRPAAMLLLEKNATVTLCHTRTADLAQECRRADVLIAAAGVRGLVGSAQLRPGQAVIDVGIHVDPQGKLAGDVDFAAAEAVVDALTPVPGGVGAITTCVLALHVVQAAERSNNSQN